MTELFSTVNDDDVLHGKKIHDGSPIVKSPFTLTPQWVEDTQESVGRVVDNSFYEAASNLSKAFGAGVSSLIPEESPVKEFVEETFIRNPHEYNLTLRAREKNYAENIAVSFLSPLVQIGMGHLGVASLAIGGSKYAESTIIEGQSELEGLQRGLASGSMFYVGGKVAMMPSLPKIKNSVSRAVAEMATAGGLFTAFSSAEIGLQEAINAEYGKETDFARIASAENIVPSFLMGAVFKGASNVLARKNLSQEDIDAINTLDADAVINIPESDNAIQNTINKEAFEVTLQALGEDMPIPEGTFDNVNGFVRKDPFLMTGDEFNKYVLQIDSDNFKLKRPPPYISPLPNINRQIQELKALISDELPQDRINEIVRENEEIALAFKENQERIDTNRVGARLEPEAISAMENIQTNNFLELERQYAIKAYKRQLQKLESKKQTITEREDTVKNKGDLSEEDIAALMAKFDEEPVDELLLDEIESAPIDVVGVKNADAIFIPEYANYKLLGVGIKDIRLADINVDASGMPLSLDGKRLNPRPYKSGDVDQYPESPIGRDNEPLTKEEWDNLIYEREFDELVEQAKEREITDDIVLEKVTNEIQLKETELKKVIGAKSKDNISILGYIKSIGGISKKLLNDITGGDNNIKLGGKYGSRKLFNEQGAEIDRILEGLYETGHFKRLADDDTMAFLDQRDELISKINDEISGIPHYPENSKAFQIQQELIKLNDVSDSIQSKMQSEAGALKEYLGEAPVYSPFDSLPKETIVTVDGVDMTVSQFDDMLLQDYKQLDDITRLLDDVIKCKGN